MVESHADAMKQDDVKQRLLTMGSEASPMTPEAFAEFVKNERPSTRRSSRSRAPA